MKISNTYKLILGAGTILMLLLACSLPLSAAAPTPTPQPALPSSTAPAAATPPGAGSASATPEAALPSPTPPEPVAPTKTPGGPDFSGMERIKPLTPGAKFKITFIEMQNQTGGWAIGGAQDPGSHILITQDGGKSWRDVSPPEPLQTGDPDAKKAHAFFLDDQTAWVTYSTRDSFLIPDETWIWFTQDGGANWEARGGFPMSGMEEFFTISDLFFIDRDNGWLLAGVGAGMSHYYASLYRTADGGANWERIADPSGENPLQLCAKTGMAFGDSFTGWITRNCMGVMDGAHVLGTGNGGALWNFFDLPPSDQDPDRFKLQGYCYSHSPQFYSPVSGSVAVTCIEYADDNSKVETSYIYTSIDSGFTWSSSGYPGGALLVLDNDFAFALGRDIYRTHDGGASWQLVKTVNWDGQFSFVSQTHGWAVAREGDEIALVYTENGGGKWDLIEAVIVP